MRCNEQLESLPFSSDHLWKCKAGTTLPEGVCVNCGLSSDEWEELFTKRLEELGLVGVAILVPLVRIEVHP
jgi:hypothetical protein